MYKVDDGKTYFKLAKGTKIPFGSETVVLNVDTDVYIEKGLSIESISETLSGSGLGATSVALLYPVEEVKEAAPKAEKPAKTAEKAAKAPKAKK